MTFKIENKKNRDIMTTRKIFQKSIICVLTLALALGLMPSVSGMFGAIKAYANSNGGAAANTSSISTYATKAQLADDTFAPNSSGVATNIGKINFGSFTWYLLGGDSKIEGDNAVIFATSQIASGMFNLDTGDSKNPGSDYGTYPEGSSIETVWGNHYGSSRHRDTLKSAASNTAYFSAKQQSMMNATTVTTKDIKNDVDYTTADKLYALASDGEYESKIIKAGTDDNKILSMGTYWSSGSFFWLRTPSTYASRNVIGPIPGRGCVAQQVNNIAGLTRPASNLNLSDVAFSSA